MVWCGVRAGVRLGLVWWCVVWCGVRARVRAGFGLGFGLVWFGLVRHPLLDLNQLEEDEEDDSDERKVGVVRHPLKLSIRSEANIERIPVCG